MSKPDTSTILMSVIAMCVSAYWAIFMIGFSVNYIEYRTADFTLIDNTLRVHFDDDQGNPHKIRKKLEYTRRIKRIEGVDTLTVLYDQATGKSTVREVSGKPLPIWPVVFLLISLFVFTVTVWRLVKYRKYSSAQR